ncbi:MAG TPA: hypothetical protein VNY05_04885 [Candidatus Acidoferrales bacterium]|jgi:hypothetical protein|nr:hypothetical protein [Candidatus Acidoferrales bacterium]
MTSRKEAVERGLHFIFQHSLAGEHFDEWAGDYLWCFYCISRTASDPDLRRRALEMGAQSARRWYAQENHAQESHGKETALPALADASEVAYYISLMDVARRLGVDDPRLRQHLGRKVGQFTARDYLGFDPAQEPPPDDLPARCGECETQSPGGEVHCVQCGAELEIRSRYDVWCDALVLTYTADGFGMPLGASHSAVACCAPAMRPYPGTEGAANTKFADIVYAITHLVYTLNDYSRFRLLPEWLPQEFEYLRAHLQSPIDADDPELLGEFLDCLRAFGLTDTDPGIAAGVEYLLAHQNADGSWGDVHGTDVHKRYHTTWTAIDALREYQWAEFVDVPDAIQRLRTEPASHAPVPSHDLPLDREEVVLAVVT